jgi:hypothetical protein
MKSLYVAHNKDIFISPDSALVSRGNPWFVPEDGEAWRAKVLIGTCITRLGMHISEQFAQRYYQNFIAAVHTYSSNANNSVEWCRDGALVTGPGVVAATATEPMILSVAQQTTTIDATELRRAIDSAIAYVSTFVTLKTGDLVLFDANVADFDLAQGFDFDVLIGETQMLHFKTR